MPRPDVLAALGKMTLLFAETEYWVNMGIIEADSITDKAAQKKACGRGFGDRVTRLRNALTQQEKQGLITFGKNLIPALSFLDDLEPLTQDRNDLLHGATYALHSPSASDGTRHVTHNVVSENHLELTVSVLDALSARLERCNELFPLVVGKLAAAKEHNGEQPLTFRSFPIRDHSGPFRDGARTRWTRFSHGRLSLR